MIFLLLLCFSGVRGDLPINGESYPALEDVMKQLLDSIIIDENDDNLLILCKEESQVSDEIIDAMLVKFKPDSDTNLKNFLFCLGKKFGMQDESGKIIDSSLVIDLAKAFDIEAITGENMYDCVTDEMVDGDNIDGGEIAFKIVDCLLNDFSTLSTAPLWWISYTKSWDLLKNSRNELHEWWANGDINSVIKGVE